MLRCVSCVRFCTGVLWPRACLADTVLSVSFGGPGERWPPALAVSNEDFGTVHCSLAHCLAATGRVAKRAGVINYIIVDPAPEPRRWGRPAGQALDVLLALTLGTGAFGSVRLVHDKATKKLLALKSLKRRNINKYLESEIVNHSLLRHPHVIQFREVFLTQEHVCILMEYANGGSLFDLVRTQKRLKETQARWFFQQLILALDYCHRRGVANRDIKLENCLLQNEDGLPHPLLKICDFGYSKADFRSAAKSQVGTLSYMAPEVVKSGGTMYDAKQADIWSAGVVLYIMLYGKYPYDLDDDVEVSPSNRSQMMLERMEQEKYPLPSNVLLSTDCTDFIRRLLKPNPKQRLTLEGVLSHPWFLRKLPPHAQEMNDYYFNLPMPDEHQRPEQIRQLLQKARRETALQMAPPAAPS